MSEKYEKAICPKCGKDFTKAANEHEWPEGKYWKCIDYDDLGGCGVSSPFDDWFKSSEKIEAGDMVWGVEAKDKSNFSHVAIEYIGYDKIAKTHAFWRKSRDHIIHWTGVTAIDPHAPDFIPDGCELWEYDNGSFIVHDEPDHHPASLFDIYRDFGLFDRLEGFVHETGAGESVVCDGPVLWTEKDVDQVFNGPGKSGNRFKTKLIGIVMKKAQND